jgi:hypothetical protein
MVTRRALFGLLASLPFAKAAVPAFTSGGYVLGLRRKGEMTFAMNFAPHGSDVVPIMLTPGELVLNGKELARAIVSHLPEALK